MTEGGKTAVSAGIRAAGLRNATRLAKHLRVSDSDIIRYALKSTLARMALLSGGGVRRHALPPESVEARIDHAHHFDLDTT